jgi:hypothetical protein
MEEQEGWVEALHQSGKNRGVAEGAVAGQIANHHLLFSPNLFKK